MTDTSRSGELKPCPFCGSEATMDQFESVWGGLLTVIGCGSSECHMSPATDEVPVEMAIAAWNGRPTEDANERLREALHGISEFGERHPGYGYSCHLLARAALGEKQ